jgi:gliding motility-associated-like protein
MKTLKTQQYIFLILSCLITLNVSAQRSNFDFVENKGQWDSRVKFMGDVGSGSFYLEKQGFTVLLHNPEDLEKVLHHGHSNIFKSNSVSALSKTGNPDQVQTPDNGGGGKPGNDNNAVVHSHAYRVKFEGAADNIDIVPSKPLDEFNNYLIGSNTSSWATQCKIYKIITYKNIYPGIDVRYYSDAGSLKYDIVVNPGANPNIIAMKYEGADKLSIKNKQLYISTSVGEVKELYPYSYQFDNVKGKTEVDCKYEIVNGNTVKFKVRNYAANVPLVIDPTLIFSTFTGSTVDNWGFTATPGPDGSLFAGGIVWGSGYPLSTGAIQQSFMGDKVDMGITRFNPRGTARMYSTYLGGSGNDFPLSMMSDAQGNLVITGRTYSTNFPGPNGGFAKLLGPGGGSDLIVVKLNPTGTGIIGSLRIGGKDADAVNVEDQRLGSVGPKSTLHFYGDDSRGEVILDAANNIYVTTQTQSNDFYTLNAFQALKGGGQDGAILKIDPNCSNVIFSSFLGGSEDDGVFVMALSPMNGNIYVAGTTAGATASGTATNSFPGNKAGTLQPTYNAAAGNPTDGFVTEIAANGSTIIRTTYLGTDRYDAVYGLKFDRVGYPYVMGITRSANWPVQNATYSIPNTRQFVAKLQPDLSAYVYSTVFGSPGAQAPNISPVAFLVDRCENVYISGWGGSLTANSQTDAFGQAGTQGMPVTPDAVKVNSDNKDFYFIVIKKNATQLLYGSFFGQSGGFTEHVDGGTSRYDQQGVIYQALCANCEGNSLPNSPVTVPYPVTPDAVARDNGAGDRGCNLGAVKIAFNFAGVGAGLRAYIDGVFDTSGCVPVNVMFRDTIRNAVSYEWDFGDGSPQATTTDPEIPHTYNAIGNYRVMMVAIDPTSCNVRDTAYTTIRVRNDEAYLSFTFGKSAGPCESLSYDFVNTSTHSPTAKNFTNQSFIWDFGDGTRVVSGLGNISHSYASPGTYKVQLILPDTNYCNAPDADTISLRVAPLVKAQIETPPTGCAPYNAVFNNTSLAGASFFWDFGDGTTSTAINPTHHYPVPGTFTIKLVAVDTNTCNKIDSTTITITVSGKPTAAFTYSPTTPQQNFPFTFTNTSSPDANRFTWIFGDGDTYSTISRADVEHQYNASGTFRACLAVVNSSGCPDTACAELQNIIVPKLDVPNAFAPLGPAPNNIVYVRGFGISRMKWRVYNRVGNLVFESNDKMIGWDGKYKGVVQPMDVYAFTLEVEFTDGTRATRKGDITLLR